MLRYIGLKGEFVMLIDTIKKAKIAAMKAHDEDQKNAANVIINKYMLLSISKKEKGIDVIDDAEVISLISKTLKELEEEKQGYLAVSNQARATSIANQIEFLKTFLPEMMTEEEIKAEILKLEDKSIPSVMKHFKANFAGKVEMSLVSKVLKSL